MAQDGKKPFIKMDIPRFAGFSGDGGLQEEAYGGLWKALQGAYRWLIGLLGGLNRKKQSVSRKYICP